MLSNTYRQTTFIELDSVLAHNRRAVVKTSSGHARIGKGSTGLASPAGTRGPGYALPASRRRAAWVRSKRPACVAPSTLTKRIEPRIQSLYSLLMYSSIPHTLLAHTLERDDSVQLHRCRKDLVRSLLDSSQIFPGAQTSSKKFPVW